MRDYIGKTVFIGIDVHRKTYSVTAVCNGVAVKKTSMPASPEGLVTHLQKCFSGATLISAYEAGFSGFALHRILESSGIKNLVVDAASIEVAANDKVKTDKRDSAKIAKHLAGGMLVSIRIPTALEEDWRELVRTRNQLVKDKRRASNQIKSLLYKHGLINDESTRRVSEAWLKEVQDLAMNPGVQVALRHHVEKWRHMKNSIKELEKASTRIIEEQSELAKDLPERARHWSDYHKSTHC